jgi:hypothetical protein
MTDDFARTSDPTGARRPLVALSDAGRALGASASLRDAAPG